MANRAYLVANNDARTAGASGDGATYDGSEILAAASSLIPALWLSLFAEENLLHHTWGDQRIPTLLSSMKDARKRFRSRRKLLKETFRANLEAISAFEKLINEAHFDFVKVDATEIWGFDAGSFESRLASAVGWFSSAEDADFEHLLDLAEIGDYERGGKTAAGECLPKHNLLGYGWVRDTPWDDEEECVEAAIDDEPREIVFGALSQRGIEKHPFLRRLAALDYFSHAGEAIDIPWAKSQGADIVDAFLTHAVGTDWPFVKLAAWPPVMEWVRENIQGDAEQFFRDQKDEIDTACHTIFWERIWRRLPATLRNCEIALDHYFVWDLMHMTIEYELVARGMPGGLHSRLLDVYEAGHLPCGWDGDFPAGRLVVY